MNTVGTFGQLSGSIRQMVIGSDSEGVVTTFPQLPGILFPVGIDPESMDRNLVDQWVVLVSELVYQMEKSPAPANPISGMPFDEYRIDLRNTRLPLALTFTGLSAIAIASLFALPFPYGAIALVALLGPASVTAYGLRTQPN